MKYGLWILLTVLLTSCGEVPKQYAYTSRVYRDLKDGSQGEKELKYQNLKKRIQHKRQLFTEEFQRSDQAHRKDLQALSKKYVYTTLVDTVFPYWYDTRWDYNGTSQIPGKGKIACGYFVTTCLRDLGFEIQRTRLAQQASSKIIETICGKGKTHIIGNNDLDQLESYLLQQEDGVFIIGLDNHVGFVHKYGDQLKIIHSNGVSGSLKVVSEPLKTSKLVLKSKAFYLGNILSNDQLFLAWMQHQKIPMII